MPLVSCLGGTDCPSPTSPESPGLLDLALETVYRRNIIQGVLQSLRQTFKAPWSEHTALYVVKVCVSGRQLFWDHQNETIHLRGTLWFSKLLIVEHLIWPSSQSFEAGRCGLSLSLLFTFLQKPGFSKKKSDLPTHKRWSISDAESKLVSPGHLSVCSKQQS